MSKTPVDHPRVTHLPVLVKDRIHLDKHKINLKSMVSSVLKSPSRNKQNVIAKT